MTTDGPVCQHQVSLHMECPDCKAEWFRTNPEVNTWNPMTKPIDIKHLGKLAEECGELVAAISRCVIQGIDESEPGTNKSNRKWLEEEIADVQANISLVIGHFQLNRIDIEIRSNKKKVNLRKWHQMLVEEPK